MTRSIRLLVLEDMSSDAELVVHQLVRAGFEPDWVRVETEQNFVAQLRPDLDLVIADFKLPQFTGLEALRRVRESGLDVPVIIVSGTIGEELAVQLIKEGATDYLLKDRLARLGAAASQALELRDQRANKRRAEQALKQREECFRALVEDSTDGIALYGRNGKLSYASPAVGRILGYGLAELSGLCPRNLVHPEDARHASALLSKLLDRPGERAEATLRCRHRDGGWRWLEGVAGNLLEEPAVAAVVLNFRDITERRQHQERILRLGRIRAVLSGINATIVRVRDRAQLLAQGCEIVRTRGGFESVWIGLCGGVEAELRWIQPSGAPGTSEGEPPQLVKTLAAEVLTWGRPAVRNDVRDAEGLDSHSLAVLPLALSQAPTGVLGLRTSGEIDDEELNMLTEVAADLAFALDYIDKAGQLDYLAFHDPVTDLPNRRLFRDRLGQALELAPQSRGTTVAVVGFDQSSGVVETFGQPAADRLFRLMAERLQGALGTRGGMAHLGAGVFGIMMPEPSTGTALAHAIEAGIVDPLSQPFAIGGQALTLSSRAGIAVAPGDGLDSETLLHNAEAALLKARQSSERYVFYSQEIHQRMSRKLTLENRLHTALEKDQFLLFYQPKVDSRTGRILGLEALLRWEDPQNGMVLPGEIIPVLEETGLIVDVGNWIIQRAVTDYRTWSDTGLEVPSVAVNVSPKQMRQKHFVDRIEEAVREFRRGRGLFELEITESVLMDDTVGSLMTIETLRELGAQVAIDDFGTGYSSLSYLSRMPVSALKIDQSFVANMTKGPNDMAIVTSVISLAHALNLVVIAEGVETEEQANLLRLLRCDQMQGFLRARPVGPEQTEALLRAESP